VRLWQRVQAIAWDAPKNAAISATSPAIILIIRVRSPCGVVPLGTASANAGLAQSGDYQPLPRLLMVVGSTGGRNASFS
jgi:hypothetical protein